jgi:hypothetical protein
MPELEVWQCWAGIIVCWWLLCGWVLYEIGKYENEKNRKEKNDDDWPHL